MLKFFVHGIPRPQGSKRGFYRNGRVVLVEASKQLPEWRNQIVLAAKEAMLDYGWATADTAVKVECIFFMPKPKTVKRKYPIVAPDTDKLLRGLFDALTASKVVSDDQIITDVVASKRYSDTIGCSVIVTIL